MRVPTSQTLRYAAVAGVVAAVGAGTAGAAAHYISGAKVAPHSLPGNRVVSHSLTSKQLSTGVNKLLAKAGTPGLAGKDGAAGATGATGAAGADGKNGVTQVIQNEVLPTPTPTPAPTATPTPTPSPTPGPLGGDRAAPTVVSDDNLQGWTLSPKGDNDDTTPNGTVGFAAAPTVTPPATNGQIGSKSLELTSANSKSVVAYLPLPAGGAGKTYLSDLRIASFSQYIAAEEGSGTGVSLQFEVTGSTSTKFASGYTTVVFDPYLNSDGLGKWKRNSLLSGGASVGQVYSSQAGTSAHPNDCNLTVAPGTCSFSTWVSENPDAVVQTIKLRTGQNNGLGFHGIDAFIDDVNIQFDGGELTRFDLGN